MRTNVHKKILVLQPEANALFTRRVKGLRTSLSADMTLLTTADQLPVVLPDDHPMILMVDPAVWAATPALASLNWDTIIFSSHTTNPIPHVPVNAQVLRCSQDLFEHPQAGRLIHACSSTHRSEILTLRPWADVSWDVRSTGQNWSQDWFASLKATMIQNCPLVTRLRRSLEELLTGVAPAEVVSIKTRSCGARMNLTLKVNLGVPLDQVLAQAKFQTIQGLSLAVVDGTNVTFAFDVPLVITTGETPLCIIWDSGPRTQKQIWEAAG